MAEIWIGYQHVAAGRWVQNALQVCTIVLRPMSCLESALRLL